MNRAIAVFLLIAITSLLVASMWQGKALAKEEPSLSQIIANQNMIIEKLDALNKKIDTLEDEINKLRMRIRR